MKNILVYLIFTTACLLADTRQSAPQIYKPDLATGRAPTSEEVAAIEKESAAHPDDLQVVRKLGKAYFYQFFGAGDETAAPKARTTLTRALAIRPNDVETMAFLGSLERLTGHEQGGKELMTRARKIDPSNVAVLSLLSGFGDVTAMEQLRSMPEFASMSDHGRQRILLSLGKDRARRAKRDEARALFSEGLSINNATREARMLTAEIERLK